MKKFSTLAIIVGLIGGGLLLMQGCKPKATAPKMGSGTVQSAEPTSFKDVTSKLDPGGSVYVYLSTEQWLKNLSGNVGNLREIVTSLPAVQDQKQQVNDAFTIGTGLIKDSGIEDVSGVGMSSVMREPGMYYNKVIIHHYAEQANGFLWTMFGKAPHELHGLELSPTNTALAAFYDLNAAQVWEVIQKACDQSSFPQAKQALKDFPQNFEKGTGMKWEDVIDSFDGEFGVIMTLDDSKIVTIPTPQQQLQIPEPALIIVAKTKNDTLFDHIDASIKKGRQRGWINVNESGLKMRTMPVPVPIPITLRPSFATSGGYFFFSTSDAAIRAALAVKGGKPGLKSTDEFKTLSANVPDQGNQFCFMSKRFGQAMIKVQQQAMAANPDMPPKLKEFLQSLAQPDKAGFTYTVGANTDEGWLVVANGNQSSISMVAGSAVVPAVAAAAALPAMARAKENSQRIACINNLRMIEIAKGQWAMEKGKTSGDVPSWSDLQPYLASTKGVLHCPKGGDYTLGAVGEHPLCTVPGHMLPVAN